MYVFSRQTCVVAWKGSAVRMHAGDVWHADDPFVKERPEFFDTTPTKLHSTYGFSVEQATAAPGEKRNVRRKND